MSTDNPHNKNLIDWATHRPDLNDVTVAPVQRRNAHILDLNQMKHGVIYTLRPENESVMLPWLMKAPWKMQSIFLSGLRAPDVHTTATKRIVRWMRGLSQQNADPSKGYMEPQYVTPELMNLRLDELEYLTCHYVHHFADSLRVLSLYHPDQVARDFALAVHNEVAVEIFHFKPETDQEFTHRHRDKVAH